MTGPVELKKEHFKHICDQTNYFNDKLTEAFTFFVQTFSAIVGGSIWLAFQREARGIPKGPKVLLSDSLVILLTAVTVARVIGNLTAWWGARNMQHTMLASVPPPRPIVSTWLEILLVFSVCAGCALFCLENPFEVLGAS